MSCESCKQIITSKRGFLGHAALIESNKRRANVVGQNIWIIDYVRSVCGSKWRYEDDKNDKNAGWTKLTD